MLTQTNGTNNLKNKTFTYNLLNLPQTVIANTTTTTTSTLTYTYDAAGNKLRRTSTGLNNTTDYISGIQYDGSTTPALNFIQTEEGKAVYQPSTGGFEYEYYLGDNLGNTRVTFGTKTGAAVVYQTDDYYPFGMEINSYTSMPKNEYLYNKKELQEELGQYDYGARFYDPVIGRWNVIDPLAEQDESLSPFIYGENDPILMTDPDGMEAENSNQGGTQPPPKQLKEVVIKGVKKSKPKPAATVVLLPEALRLSALNEMNSIFSNYTPLGRTVMVVTNLMDMANKVDFSKIGTPRKKSAKQLRKEWERATGKTWPKEPNDPTKNQVAHHIKPLADGGEDGYPNIEPKPADEHRSWHQALGDFIRWGSARAPDVD